MSQPMNREQRRLLKKQGQEVDESGQVVATRAKTKTSGSGGGSGGRTTPTGGSSGDGGGGKRRREAPQVEERTSPRQFAREVRSELRKVSWPTRAEVINYSLVVFFTVVFLTVLIGILDWAFSSSLLKLFET